MTDTETKDRLETRLVTLEQTATYLSSAKSDKELAKTVRDLVKRMAEEGWELRTWGDANTFFSLYFDDEEQHEERDLPECLPKFEVYLHGPERELKIWFKESGEYFKTVEDAVNGVKEFWGLDKE